VGSNSVLGQAFWTESCQEKGESSGLGSPELFEKKEEE